MVTVDRDHILTQLQVEKVEALKAGQPSPLPIQLEILLPGLATAEEEEDGLRRHQAVQRLLQGEDQDPMGPSQ